VLRSVGHGQQVAPLWDAGGVRYRFAGGWLDDRALTVGGPGGEVHVEPQVFEVLRYLLVHRDRVVAKEELLDAVWGDRFVSESALTSRIKAARRAVGDDGQAQRVIRTVHARGYRFVADVATDAGGQRRALPRLRTTLIGRDGDIGRVAEQVGRVPVLTVTGSGGIGKTTLALAVADRLADGYADGVVFVDLAPVPAGADVTRAVADAAGLEGGAAESLAGVADHLAHRPVLLVVDNCEHVLHGAAAFADRVLAAGGTAHVLATSREPLGVAGEHVWPLGPLHDDAPALFVERARAAEPRVDWDAADPLVVELCRRLDGLPLALELAAGQLRRFDLADLNRRLDDRLALLAGRASHDAHRHATMEMTIDWSYRLLDEVEQALLRQLSVFPAAFDIDAVEATAPPLGADALATFGQLVDKSLVVRLAGSGRYRLLETIRLFARDRLGERGEAADAFERHRRHVRDRVVAAPRLDRWLSARLGAGFRSSLDDARQGFDLSVDHGEAEDAVDIALGASFLWRNALGCVEGEGWVDRLLDLDLPPEARLWAQILRADVGQGRGDHHQMFEAAAVAESLVTDAVADAARSPGAGDADRGEALAAACVAAHFGALVHLTDPATADGPLALALDRAHAAGDARLVTLIGVFRAVADLSAGRNDDARAAVARLDRTASEDGYDRFLLHWAAWMLGLAERDAAVARRWINDQYDYLARTGIVETWITTLSTAMCDVLDRGDPSGGGHAATLARTLVLAEREGYHAEADCMLVLAYAELCAGRFEGAAELVGTAMHRRFNATAHHVLYKAVIDPQLCRHLGAEARAAAMARGRKRIPSEALAEHGVDRTAT